VQSRQYSIWFGLVFFIYIYPLEGRVVEESVSWPRSACCRDRTGEAAAQKQDSKIPEPCSPHAGPPSVRAQCHIM
jgi:hypothetical protein